MDNPKKTTFDVSKNILETKRLILRPWYLSDIDDLFEYASIAGVGEMAGWKTHENLNHSKEVLFSFIISRNVYAVMLKSNHKVIGSIGVEEIQKNHLGSDFNKLKGREIGYVLNKDYWGQGLMPEAVNSIVANIFKKLDFDFLMCAHFENNIQSERVIRKTGFTFFKDIKIPTLFNQKQNTKIYIQYNPYRNNEKTKSKNI